MSQWIEIIPTDKKTFPPEKVEVLAKTQDKNGIRNICILTLIIIFIIIFIKVKSK